MLDTRAELLEALTMPYDRFEAEITSRAKALWRARGDRLQGVAMAGFSNVCLNQCLYCGMRAANQIPRFLL